MKSGMRLLLKLAGIMAALVVVGIVAATIAVRKYLPPERIRFLIIANAQKTLKREVRLEKISLNLLKGLTIHSLEVSEAPDFKAGQFLRVESFNFKIQWRPLLSKRIVVDRIALKSLRLNIQKAADGRFNFADLMAPEKKSAPTSAAAGVAALALELNIRQTSIINGEIAYLDATSSAAWSISNLNAKIKDFSLTRPFDAECDLKADGRLGASPISASVSFAGAIDLAGQNQDKMSVSIKLLEVANNGIRVKASGTVIGATSPTLDLKTKISSANSDILSADIVATLPHVGLVPLEATIAIKAQSSDLKTSDLKSLGLALPESLSVPAAELNANLTMAGEDLKVSALRLKTKFGQVDASGAIKKFQSSKPEPDLNIALNLNLPAFKSSDLAFVPQVPPDLMVPASQVSGSVAGGMDRLSLSALRLKLGGNDIEAEGTITGLRSDPQLDMLVKCRSFLLEQLTQVSPQTREMNLAGNGFFAVAVNGPMSKPVLGGKMTFKGLGATLSGLKLSDFTGVAKFDERRIDIPKLTGQVGDGALAMDLTVKNYAKSPAIELEASLTQFDMEKFLTARAAAAAQMSKKAASPQAKTATPPLQAKGRFTVDKLTYSNAVANDMRLSWELSGITPDMKDLSGWAKLGVGGGKLENLGAMATKSKVVKVLVFPLMVIQKIGGISGARLFPDLNNVNFQEIIGDYEFENGIMTLKESRFDSDAANAKAEGTIDLPAEKLNLLVTAQVGNVAPIEVDVKGTFDNPQSKPRIGKFLAAPAKQFFQRLIGQ